MIKETRLKGCFEIIPNVFEDTRGKVIKPFEVDEFKSKNLEIDFTEDLIVYSKCGVIRGLHFQTHPYEQTKLVYCIDGCIFDVVVDLRPHSKTYRQYECFELSSTRCNMLYIPKGFAHGYCTHEGDSIIGYKLTSTYSIEHDKGIHYKSFNIPWPIKTPNLSQKDCQLPLYEEDSK